MNNWNGSSWTEVNDLNTAIITIWRFWSLQACSALGFGGELLTI